MNLRLKKIQAKLKTGSLDALIVSSDANISYLTGYLSRDAYLIISPRKNFYITDSRYSEEAKKNLSKDFIIKESKGSVFKLIADACLTLGLRRIGFEERYLPLAEYKKIQQELGSSKRLIATHSLTEGLRQIKNSQELSLIKKAVRITINAFKFIQKIPLVGKKETEVAGELERFIRYEGAYNSSFDIIVASGPNSSFPHHISGWRKIRNNEPLLIDIGVEYLGYKSDLTRVMFLGKINPLARRIYDIVRQAQENAINKIKPAVSINKIDAAARQYITQNGYGSFFGHNLGHGVGLEVHENPHICGAEFNGLEAGMVFTIEPGIYLPNQFGIRLEDMVLVTKKGVEVLSGALDK